MRPAGVGRGPETHVVTGSLWTRADRVSLTMAACSSDSLLAASNRYQPELLLEEYRSASGGTMELQNSQASGREKPWKVLGLQWQLIKIPASSHLVT